MIYSGKLITDFDADKCLLQITILWLDILNTLFTIDKFCRCNLHLCYNYFKNHGKGKLQEDKYFVVSLLRTKWIR